MEASRSVDAEAPALISSKKTIRQALQSLPATPLNKRPTPIHISSSLSKPLCVRTQSSQTSIHPDKGDVLTPPHTPRSTEDQKSLLSTPEGAEDLPQRDDEQGPKRSKALEELGAAGKYLEWLETTPKPYRRKYKLLDSASSSGHEEFGRGVWSVVYRAEGLPDHPLEPELPTPPTSPLTQSRLATSYSFFAVKAPLRRDAHQVLDNEARILTYLHQTSDAKDYLVQFHGYDSEQHSIILDAYPLTLATHAKSALVSTRASFTTKTMLDPVVGRSQWAEIAQGLINGLAFLHNCDCVHGDIKPANILLQPTSSSTFRALYCDFSSSHIFCPLSSSQIDEVSAVTPDFTSPELLASFYHRDGSRAVATFASDVFALGVTLVVAATGESPYAGARMEFQKLGMAKEGRPIEFARASDQASRVMKGRMVVKSLVRALAKDPVKRVSAMEWKSEVLEALKG